MTTTDLRLREWRTRRGLSLRDLGEKSGIGYPNIQRIETGTISPTVATLESLARALGITVRDLFPSSSRSRSPKTRKEAKKRR